MIDADGFRLNVGIVLANKHGKVLWARRVLGNEAWQFPQGGVREGESLDDAMFRELYEEVGLNPEHIEVLASTKELLHYKLPKRLIRKNTKPVCIGQKQCWYLLRLIADDSNIKLDCSESPEFNHWRWVDYWYPLDNIIPFKRDVYKKALTELHPNIKTYQEKENN